MQKRPSNWQADVLELAGGSKTTPIVAYCAAGVRAQQAVNILSDEGYTATTNGGGFPAQRDELEAVCTACRNAGGFRIQG